MGRVTGGGCTVRVASLASRSVLRTDMAGHATDVVISAVTVVSCGDLLGIGSSHGPQSKPGRRAIIASLDKAIDALEGKEGTIIK